MIIKPGDYKILSANHNLNLTITFKIMYKFKLYTRLKLESPNIIRIYNLDEVSIILKKDDIITLISGGDNQNFYNYVNNNWEYLSPYITNQGQNHVIDPTYFYDAIEMFSFDYDLYRISDYKIDDYGKRVASFTHEKIRGSLQSRGKSLNQSKEGNTQSMSYNFYCKSFYRINIGDFINYKERWLHVNSVQDFDEYGCRSCSMNMVQLTDYKDLEEYVKYIRGEIII